MTLIPGNAGSETSPRGGEQPLFQGSASSFIPEIRGEIILLNEAAIQVEDALRFPLLTKEKTIAASQGNLNAFRLFMNRLSIITKNTAELLPENLHTKLENWIAPSQAFLSQCRTYGDLKTHFLTGLVLSSQLQKELHALGIKDTNREEFETFPFKVYLTFTKSLSEYSDPADVTNQDPDDLLPDELFLHPDNEGSDYPAATNEIMGFSGNNAFAAMYWTYFSNVSQLLANRKYRQAREYFYLFLGDVAVLFDELFLDNCIKIEESIFGTDPKNQKRTYQNVLTVFNLHRAELSALMARAHISPKPDVRQIINTPMDVPKTIDDVIPSPEAMK